MPTPLASRAVPLADIRQSRRAGDAISEESALNQIAASISAVIPTFNRRRYIGRALESILRQNPNPSEIIVVDDGSTDGTADALEAEFGPAIRIVRQPNGGNAIARARGVREAKGKWIAFLDSDDEWTPGRMARFVEALGRVPDDVAWVFGDSLVVKDDRPGESLFSMFGLRLEKDLEIFDRPLDVQFPYQFGLFQSSIIRRAVLMELDCFSPALRSSVDVLAGFKVACRYRFAAIPEVVTRFSRTADLRKSSVAFAGDNTPDYYFARMLSFGWAADVDPKGPWGRLHQDAVRGYCLAEARAGRSPRREALKQFRYHRSMKAIGFAFAAMLGRPGIACWNAAKRLLRSGNGQGSAERIA